MKSKSVKYGDEWRRRSVSFVDINIAKYVLLVAVVFVFGVAVESVVVVVVFDDDDDVFEVVKL